MSAPQFIITVHQCFVQERTDLRNLDIRPSAIFPPIQKELFDEFEAFMDRNFLRIPLWIPTDAKRSPCDRSDSSSDTSTAGGRTCSAKSCSTRNQGRYRAKHARERNHRSGAPGLHTGSSGTNAKRARTGCGNQNPISI